VNLRAAPHTDAEILALLPDGTTVILLEQQQEVDGRVWQLVEVNGVEGWLTQEFLVVNE
jgi:hypothetical protein